MYNGKILINSLDSARAFVALTAGYPEEKITLTSNEYQVDAHSIIGILSLDLSQPLDISAEGKNTKKFIDEIKPFTV